MKCEPLTPWSFELRPETRLEEDMIRRISGIVDHMYCSNSTMIGGQVTQGFKYASAVITFKEHTPEKEAK